MKHCPYSKKIGDALYSLVKYSVEKLRLGCFSEIELSLHLSTLSIETAKQQQLAPLHCRLAFYLKTEGTKQRLRYTL
jgi:hypothetical protein